MARIIRTAAAQRDIFSVFDFIASDNFGAATSWVDKLDRTLQSIAKSPLIGEQVDDLGIGIRRYCFGAYLLFYKPLDDGIELRRELHGARRIEDLT
jgi:toxin ParE1/3/4